MYRSKYREFSKFVIVGGVSFVTLYAIYYTLLFITSHNIAYTLGYIGSFILNYILTVTFTFQASPNKKNAAGFLFSHITNYLLQLGLLNLMLFVGMNPKFALIPAIIISVPINFLMVRYFIRK